MNFKRLLAIARKEFIQIRRDRPTLAIILVLPIMMMLIFGYAVSTDVDRIATAVLNQDPGAESRLLIDKFAQSTYFQINSYVDSVKDLRGLIDGGQVKAGLVIPPDYVKKLARGETVQIQMLIDGSDPLVASTALATGQVIAQVFSAEIVAERLENTGLGGRINIPVEYRPRVWYNPNLESLRFNLPGLVGVILQNITILLTAFALVRERERGTLEQLIVTPIKPLELVVGKIIPYMLIGFIDMLLALGAAVFWFGIEISGDIWLLLGISLVFLVGALGIGLLISTVAKTQLQGMQMAFGFLLPTILLSGFIFPRETMPLVVQGIGYVIPLTYFLQVLRGIILKGIGMEYLWREVVILGIYGVAVMALAGLRFRKKLD